MIFRGIRTSIAIDLDTLIVRKLANQNLASYQLWLTYFFLFACCATDQDSIAIDLDTLEVRKLANQNLASYQLWLTYFFSLYAVLLTKRVLLSIWNHWK